LKNKSFKRKKRKTQRILLLEMSSSRRLLRHPQNDTS
jgi:hypothetical protein